MTWTPAVASFSMASDALTLQQSSMIFPTQIPSEPYILLPKPFPSIVNPLPSPA
jgi:hypothetical protein